MSDLPLHMGHRSALPNTAHRNAYSIPPTPPVNTNSIINHAHENFLTGSTACLQKLQYLAMNKTTEKNYKKSVVAW